MADVRKVSVPWTCDGCKAKLFGVQISDESGARVWTMLPSGWWAYPLSYGDTDGEGAVIMMHAFCSEKCIREGIDRAGRAGAAAEAQVPSKPLRTTIGDLIKRRSGG